MPVSTILQRSAQIRAQTRALRKAADAALQRAKEAIAHSVKLCNHFTAPASSIDRRPRPLKTTVIEALRQSLSDLESNRMTLSDDPVLQELKREIRMAIEHAGISC